jgi:hypothetical protein
LYALAQHYGEDSDFVRVRVRGLPPNADELQYIDRLVLESKADLQRRGETSPDDADAFVLTFARTVAPPQPEHHPQPRERRHSHYEWMR